MQFHFIIISFLFIISCSSNDSKPTSISKNVSSNSYTIDSTAIDITGSILSNTTATCTDYSNSYVSETRDINNNITFQGTLIIRVEDGKCKFITNSIPNHDFNDGNRTFITDVAAVENTYEITASPTSSNVTTSLSLQMDNAIFLNGVKLDLLAAACHNVGNEKIGCFDMDTPWRFDPMHAGNDFGTDSHNAHTQPDGSYHYHGSPMALFDQDGSIASPVIGFAADGFPIYGPYVNDDGNIRKVKSSFQLKSGERQTIDGENPGGNYDGTFVDDYEYVSNSGDLDECNGMERNGQYAYYVTDTYPWVLACFKGTPDNSFRK